VNYYLAEACQNTFILFDCLPVSEVDEPFLLKAHRCLEEEGRDDALILVGGRTQQDAFYARMIVLGQDGALGEFCGNGARACSAYLFRQYPQFQKFFLITPWGAHPLARYGEDIYSIKLPPARFEGNKKFIVQCPENLKNFFYAEMIEPHLIVQEKMSDEMLLSIGKELNQRRDIFPLGINVNAWHVLEEGTLYVKTYERGVQRLTRSCGSGSICCAAFYKSRGSVRIIAPGGEMEVILQEDGVELKGPASID